ncbi:MAG: glycosyltransferase family 9 protein [Bacteroidota bacterium]
MTALMEPDQSDPRKILIFRALQLGDMLNAVPAFRALRHALPRADISLAGLAWEQDFVRRFHAYLDEFIPFPGFPGLPEQEPDVTRLPAFLEHIQSQQFDVVLQMQGSGEIANPLIGLFGAKEIAGFYLPGRYCPDREHFLEYPEHEPEAWRHLRLMEFLGVPLQGDELEFPLFDEDWDRLRVIRNDSALQRPYVCIHPGARKTERRWPAGEFSAVADRLAEQGYQVVLTGSREEAALTASVAGSMKAPAIDLGGKTELGTLGALLSQADLLISNDTGVSHLASALKIPSVVLFAASDMDRWAPGDRRLHKTLERSLERSADEVLAHAEAHLKEVYAHVR